MPTTRATVAEAVTTCLAFCKDAPDPTAIANKFIARLQANPEWNADEVEEVRRQIEQSLAPVRSAARASKR